MRGVGVCHESNEAKVTIIRNDISKVGVGDGWGVEASA